MKSNERQFEVASIVRFPEVAVATTSSEEVGTAASTQVEVEDQLPPPLAIVLVAIHPLMGENLECALYWPIQKIRGFGLRPTNG